MMRIFDPRKMTPKKIKWIENRYLKRKHFPTLERAGQMGLVVSNIYQFINASLEYARHFVNFEEMRVRKVEAESERDRLENMISDSKATLSICKAKLELFSQKKKEGDCSHSSLDMLKEVLHKLSCLIGEEDNSNYKKKKSEMKVMTTKKTFAGGVMMTF